jgi:DNA-binding MarR family transcriptional regulator
VELKIEADPLYDLWMLLTRVQHIVARRRDRELSQYGISREVAFILYLIYYLGNNATPTAISRHTILQTSSISEMLDRMVKKGLITKSRVKASKNRLKVELTEKGRIALEKSVKRETIHQAMLSLPEKKRDQLKSCLEILLKATTMQVAIEQQEKQLQFVPSKLTEQL